jgi:RNA polymerase sigma factor (sigma-70 family)
MEPWAPGLALLDGLAIVSRGGGQVSQELGGASRRHLRTLFNVGVTAGLTDGELLERFLTASGEAAEMAFAALMERHGPMVYRTCRGVLGDDHEAQDAFQATFLVLVRRSRTLWVRDSLGPWLHRVAGRAAAHARAAGARRQALERKVAEHRSDESPDMDLADLPAILHEEIDRLPAHYRVPIVLCDLEGRSQEDAARHLGCPEGTVKSRLARGRDRLRGRLLRRGVAPAVGLPFTAAGGTADAAVLPDALVESTIQITKQVTSAAARGIPPSVAALTEGVLQMMFHGKLKLIAAGVFTAVALVVAVGSWAQQATKPGPAAPPIQPAAPVDEKRWTWSFSNGTTVEVLGISAYPTGPKTWWGPDGSPLAEAPCDPPEKHVTAQDVVYKVIAVRWTGEPPHAGLRWGVREAHGSSRDAPRRAGKPIPDVEVAVIGVASELKSCTVDFSLATGPWKTVSTAGSGASSGGANRLAYMFSEPIETKSGVLRVVTHNIGDQDVRLIAVDREGKEHLPVGHHPECGARGFYQMMREFDLPTAQVAEFQLQTRPFERLEIKDIALKRVE